MELTPELLGTAAVGAVVILGAIGNYLRSLKARPSQPDAILRGIGMELGEEQTERMIVQFTRIADSVAVLADKRTDEMEEIHKTLLDRLDMQERRKEQEEQQPRRVPRKRP